MRKTTDISEFKNKINELLSDPDTSDKTKEGLFDPRKISESVKENIIKRLDDFSKLLTQ